MTILAIETSCDDTASAVLVDGHVRSNVISSQAVHDLYGGIVPELASREHVRVISQIVDAAITKAGIGMSDIEAIAVTNGPGLAGSLLVGCHYAKGLALALGVPLYPIHHIEAHVYSGYLEDPSLTYPSIALVVSGGHTSIFQGHFHWLYSAGNQVFYQRFQLGTAQLGGQVHRCAIGHRNVGLVDFCLL